MRGQWTHVAGDQPAHFLSAILYWCPTTQPVDTGQDKMPIGVTAINTDQWHNVDTGMNAVPIINKHCDLFCCDKASDVPAVVHHQEFRRSMDWDGTQ